MEPPEGAALSLTFEDNGRQHGDLVLRVGPWVHRCDTYYYELDHPVATAPDLVAPMRALLLQWKALVASARDETPCFLAFAFYDQTTGWVRCARRGTELELCPGWSGEEGWKLYPSDTLEWATALADFEPAKDAPAVRVSAAKLLGDIDRSLAALPDSESRAGDAEAAYRRRRARLEDFVRRVTYVDEETGEATDAVQVASVGIYVAVHPMADEAALLAKLAMSPSQCTKVDAYVAMGGDVHFLQFFASQEPARGRRRGIYGRAADHDAYAGNFVFELEAAQISSAEVEDGLRALRAIVEGAPELGQALRQLS